MKKFFKKRSKKLLIAVSVFIAWTGIHTTVILFDGFNDEAPPQDQTADLIVILGNAINEDGSPTAHLQARLDKGLEVYNQKLGKKILVSGGYQRGTGYIEAEIMAKYLQDHGVPKEDLLLDSYALNTQHTANNARTIIKKNNLDSFIIVTHYYHISRTKLAFKNVGMTNSYSIAAKDFEARNLYSIPREFLAFYKYLIQGTVDNTAGTQLIIIILAISLGFFVQSTVGFAANLSMMPILLLTLPFQEAIALGSLYLLAFSLIVTPQAHVWKKMDRRTVLELGLSGLLGLFIGVQILKFADPLFLKKFFGIFLIFYVAYSLWKKTKIKWIEKAKYPIGFLGGVFSGLISSGGPFMVIYITNKFISHKKIRATIIGTFALINLSRVPLLAQSKILTLEIFIKALIALPAFLIAIYLGNNFFTKINQKTFANIILVLLLFSGITLILK